MEHPGFESQPPLEEEQCFKSSLSDLLGKDEDVFYDQELVFGVMKTLGDEITGSNPHIPQSSEPWPCSNHIGSVSGSEENGCNVDLEYLLGATDDELGIPPSPGCVAGNEIVMNAMNPIEDLFESTKRDCAQAEGILGLCDSDCWYLPYEYEFAMVNESLCQEWQARSLQADPIGDKGRMQVESGVGV